MQAELTALWQASRPELKRRVAALEFGLRQLAEGTGDAAARVEAAREAHRLIGAIGVFGFAAASRAARSMESMLTGDAPLDQRQLAAFLDDIRSAVSRPNLSSTGLEDKP